MRPVKLLVLSLAATACAPLVAKPAPTLIQPGHIDLARGPDGNTVILDARTG